MGRFVGDADYVVRWPRELIEAELRRLVDRARRHGIDREWEGEVDLLLRQAFASSVPAEDFQEILRAQGVIAYDEPF